MEFPSPDPPKSREKVNKIRPPTVSDSLRGVEQTASYLEAHGYQLSNIKPGTGGLMRRTDHQAALQNIRSRYNPNMTQNDPGFHRAHPSQAEGWTGANQPETRERAAFGASAQQQQPPLPSMIGGVKSFDPRCQQGTEMCDVRNAFHIDNSHSLAHRRLAGEKDQDKRNPYDGIPVSAPFTDKVDDEFLQVTIKGSETCKNFSKRTAAQEWGEQRQMPEHLRKLPQIYSRNDLRERQAKQEAAKN